MYTSVNWASIGSGNGLAPSRQQAITWTKADLLSIGSLGTNFSENWIEILTFSLRKMRLNMSSAKWSPCCPGEDELIRLLEINFSESKYIQPFSFKKMRLKILSVKCWPFCLSLNELMVWCSTGDLNIISRKPLKSIWHKNMHLPWQLGNHVMLKIMTDMNHYHASKIITIISSADLDHQGPLLLTWNNFNSSMDK